MTFANSFYVGASPVYQSLGLNNGFAGYPVSDSTYNQFNHRAMAGAPPQASHHNAALHGMEVESQMATAISSAPHISSYYVGAKPQYNHYGFNGFAGYKY
uniref:Uncharacterized protein n=1 Tax=Parastrongyloides trichosuri TaxID=131310 RepID=A0A0N4Z9R2_PARTI